MNDKYTLTVDIATVDSLGRNLYSNAAAVLSEFVANAWDADATRVEIQFDPNNSISILDNGCGMTDGELNSRFLTVGYRKRVVEGMASPRFKRPYMGRKGIGKLSAFSLADKMVVSSRKQDGPSHGFTIDAKEMEKSIRNTDPAGREYHPEPLADAAAEFGDRANGTKIVLSDLRVKRVSITERALRRRLARRFDVLGLANLPEDQGRFVIEINGEPVTYEDRGDLQKLQYIWYLGDYELPDGVQVSAEAENRIKNTSIPGHDDWRISGWIGSVAKPADRVFEADDESMKNIIVLARKRPIQEGLLDHLDFDKHFASYVTGQIQADFLDQDDQEDIATSDRQRLVEDDERVRAFNAKMKDIFNAASDKWSELRSDTTTKALYESVPEVREWITSLPSDRRRPAQKMISRISSIDGLNDDDRNSLYQSSIAAFYKLQQNDEIDKLKDVDTMSEAQLFTILSSYARFEELEYGQIIRTRLSVIGKLEDLLDHNELENRTRDFIAENPWLLDPSWERATEDLVKEQSFKRIAKEQFNLDFSDDAADDRLDIKYLDGGGRQVIVEFKRYGRKVKISELTLQIEKYARAMTRLLQQADARAGSGSHAYTNDSGIDARVNVIIIVKHVYSDIKDEIMPVKAANDRVRIFNARFLYFSDMVEKSKERYQEFTENPAQNDLAAKAIHALDKIS